MKLAVPMPSASLSYRNIKVDGVAQLFHSLHSALEGLIAGRGTRNRRHWKTHKLYGLFGDIVLRKRRSVSWSLKDSPRAGVRRRSRK